MKKYSTIFLDWNKTLSHSRFWEHWQDVHHPHNHIFKDIQTVLFSKSSDRINDWMRGKYTSEQIIEFIAKNTQQDYQLLLNEFIKSCQEMKYVSPRIPQLIKKLRKKGIKVVIATDNMDSFTRWTVPALRLDVLFDDVLNSYNLKVLKTDSDDKGGSIFFKNLNKNYTIKNSLLIDDLLDVKPIIKSLKIDFLHVTKESELQDHLKTLLQ